MSITQHARSGSLEVLKQFSQLSHDDKGLVLGLSAQFGHTSIVEKLLQQHSDTEHLHHGLWLAVHDGNTDTVGCLAAAIATPNTKVFERCVVLAASSKKHEILPLLIAACPNMMLKHAFLASIQLSQKPNAEFLLPLCEEYINQNIVCNLIDRRWNNLVAQALPLLDGAGKNAILAACMDGFTDVADQIWEQCKESVSGSRLPSALASAVLAKQWQWAERLLPCSDTTLAHKVLQNKAPPSDMSRFEKMLLEQHVSASDQRPKIRKI